MSGEAGENANRDVPTRSISAPTGLSSLVFLFVPLTDKLFWVGEKEMKRAFKFLAVIMSSSSLLAPFNLHTSSVLEPPQHLHVQCYCAL